MKVVFAPEFTLYNNGTKVERFIEKGADFTIQCESRENPKATTQWFYTDNDKDLSTFKLINHKGDRLKMTNMRSSMQGMYKCVVENTVGFAYKHFDVKLKPKGKSFEMTNLRNKFFHPFNRPAKNQKRSKSRSHRRRQC